MLEKYTKNGGKGFYPTPEALANRMIDEIDFQYCYTFLEPSAGKGDLAREIMRRYNSYHGRYGQDRLRIDCVEVDPYLRQILKYNFSNEALRPIRDEIREVERSSKMDNMVRWRKEQELRAKLDEYCGKENVRVVYDDFLTFWPEDKYDAIIIK